MTDGTSSPAGGASGRDPGRSAAAGEATRPLPAWGSPDAPAEPGRDGGSWAPNPWTQGDPWAREALTWGAPAGGEDPQHAPAPPPGAGERGPWGGEPPAADPWAHRPTDAPTAADPWRTGPAGPSGDAGGPAGAGGDEGDADTVDTLGRRRRDPLRRRSHARLAGLLAAVLLVGLLGGVAGGALQDALAGRPGGALDPQARLPVPASGSTERAPESTAGIAQAVLPSVVAIRIRGEAGQGTGSGFVLREDGYLLTNNHVVVNAADTGGIEVLFEDGSQEVAQVVGTTSSYDLAVLKVERTGLSPLPFGDSDAVVVGDPVLAVGAPLGLQGTVTQGIVSAKNRPVTAGDLDAPAFINAIQTDAAVNPGNSGGPLVDAQGQVIGVNSAIARPPGSLGEGVGNIGLGFAIPSNQARSTAEQIIRTGRATYPIIGVLPDFGYDGEGVRISLSGGPGTEPVTPGGPADMAGLEPGDVILTFEGRPVTAPEELIVAIRAESPGDRVTLGVRSPGGGVRDVELVLDSATSD